MDLPSGAPRELTAELDRPIGEWAWCDLLMAEEAPGPAWLSNEEIAVIVGDRGRDVPYRVALDGTAAPMIDPDTRIAACGLDVAGDRVAISAALDGTAGEVWAVEDGGLRQVTREGSAWQRRFDGVDLEELSAAGAGRADPGVARLAARRGTKATADDPPRPRRPDGSVGPGRHARRDGAVRGRLPGADAEHPRLDDVRGPVGARPVRQLGRRGRRGRARVGRRAREAGPRRPEAPGRDGPELRWLPDPVAHRCHRSLPRRRQRERRREPGVGLGQLVLRRALQPPRRPRRIH